MAEFFEGHLDLANVKGAIPTVVLIVALFRHLDSAALSPFAPHAHALGMLAMMAKGRSATRTNHTAAAIVPLLLLPQTLRKECTQCLQIKLMQPGELCWSQVRKRVRVLQPRQNLVDNSIRCGDTVKCLFEGQVVCIIIAHVLDQERARQRIKALQGCMRKPQAEGLHQDAPLSGCDWNLVTSERVEKVEEHTWLCLMPVHT